jgi:hypothetical protein
MDENQSINISSVDSVESFNVWCDRSVQAQLAPETNLVSLQAVWSFVIVAGVAQ